MMNGARTGRIQTKWVSLLISVLAVNFCWLSARRHAGYRQASQFALDSLAYVAHETRAYHEQAAKMLFHVDGLPLDTFLMTGTDGRRRLSVEWARECHSGLMAVPDARPSVTPAGDGFPSDGLPFPSGRPADPFLVVFRYTELHCMTCTERQIELMKEAMRQYPALQCVILTSYSYEAYLWQFVRMNQIDIPVYQIPLDALYGDAGVPFFFVLDASMCMHHLFVPDKSHEDWTTEYLAALGKRGRLR